MSLSAQIGSLITRIGTEVKTLRAEIAGAGGGSALAPYTFAGRYTLTTSNPWNVPDINLGWNDPTPSNTAGTGTEPTTLYNPPGIPTLSADVLKGFRFAYQANLAEVDKLNFRLINKTGTWDGTWNTTAETTHNTLYSADDFDVSTGWRRQDITLTQAMTGGDGMLMPAVKCTSTLTATRYLSFVITLFIQH